MSAGIAGILYKRWKSLTWQKNRNTDYECVEIFLNWKYIKLNFVFIFNIKIILKYLHNINLMFFQWNKYLEK